MAMKILILSCNTGEGHNSSAKALKAAMDARGIESEIQDTIALVSAAASRKVSDIYVYSTKSSMFERAYKIGALVSGMDVGLKSPVYLTNRFYAKKLWDHIVNGGYDAVVCVHLFPAEAITALKRQALLLKKLNFPKVPTIFVMTDYTCIPFLPETELDRYVIAHEDLVEEFVEKGIPREKVVPIGIPVSLTKERIPKEEARRLADKEFGWDDGADKGKWFLLMGGSMGFGNMGDLLERLLDKISDEDRVICICGRNDELRDGLTMDFGEDNRFKAIGYTDKVSLLMDASDVLFSKPGGITSTEAAIRNIPLVHTAPIPGLEDKNALFFHFHNMSYSTKDPRHQADVALRLCNDEAWRNRMLEAQRRNTNLHTCDDIIDLIGSMVLKDF